MVSATEVGYSNPMGFSGCARFQFPVSVGIPPQPGNGMDQSGRRLGRGERSAKFVQSHGAIFSKYAHTNDDVLL